MDRKGAPSGRGQATEEASGGSSGGGATDTGGARSALHSSLLGWTKKQSHILTGGGRTSDLYRPPRFPFSAEELPHHHKSRGSVHEAFDAWRLQGVGAAEASISGAWKRPLFVGGWTHSEDTDAGGERPFPLGSLDGEMTFNLQTPSIFVDMRLPKAGIALLGHHRALDTMSDFELRLFARRHAFAGYTRLEETESTATVSSAPPPKGLVATRHHAIDWNYVGQPRPRPNKWRVEMGPGGNVWKEWGFAQDEYGQHVYMERWERLPGGRGSFWALRRRRLRGRSSPVERGSSDPDAFLVVCGDHFGLIVDRHPESLDVGDGMDDASTGGLVELVDALLARGDRSRAIRLLSLEASHGRVGASRGTPSWTVDCSLHPWLQGLRPLGGALLTLSPPPEPSLSSQFPLSRVSIDWRQLPRSPSDVLLPPAAGRVGPKTSPGTAFTSTPVWPGVSLEGVWDVVECACPAGIEEQMAGLEELFAHSGARVVRESRQTGQGGTGRMARESTTVPGDGRRGPREERRAGHSKL